ncbi:ArsR family transcriptional regulator [Nocardia asiatica]|uniref:ArsR family transcriptional regulator n=1 Tax=Nocardia asiatica TaxID=209252 RepID=UPI0024569A7D|nr:ArsR family transcriptional regulator [Nocardia asiatica]
MTDLQQRAGLGQSTTSQYLAMLRQAGLVIATSAGRSTARRPTGAAVDRGTRSRSEWTRALLNRIEKGAYRMAGED